VRTWLALALACWLLAAWAQDPAPAPKKAVKPVPVKSQKAQKAHRQATPEQVRRFNELQKKQDAKR
jgi:hypothetical protein